MQVKTEERVQKAINFIEDNLYEDITIDQISDHVFFSKYHFQKLFKKYTNFNFKDYIRKRRLSDAASRLICTDDNIIDIAHDNNFNNHETFTRAFNRYYNQSPSSFREKQLQIIHFEKLELFSDFFQNHPEHITSPPQIITQKGYMVVGLEITTTIKDGLNYLHSRELRKMFILDDIAGKIPNKIFPINYIGLCTNYNPREGTINYLIGVLVKDLKDIPLGMTGVIVPSAKYVVFDATGIPDTMHEAWDNSFFWKDLHNRPYEEDKHLAFEWYDHTWPLEQLTKKQKLEPIGYRWKEVSPQRRFAEYAHHRMRIYHAIYGCACTKIKH